MFFLLPQNPQNWFLRGFYDGQKCKFTHSNKNLSILRQKNIQTKPKKGALGSWGILRWLGSFQGQKVVKQSPPWGIPCRPIHVRRLQNGRKSCHARRPKLLFVGRGKKRLHKALGLVHGLWGALDGPLDRAQAVANGRPGVE